jgi:hypothetical protein
MAYTPIVIEPEYVRMTGFHQDLTVGGGNFISFVLAQRRDVSQLAQNLIWDAVHGGTATERLGTRLGWNYMTAGNVTGFSSSNYLLQTPPTGTDAQYILKVRGGNAGTPGKITTEVTFGTEPEADLVIVTLEGGIFESEDEDDADLISWWALHAIGRGLGMGDASDDLDIMFPVFRGEADSLGPNILASECNMDALEVLTSGPPAAPAVVCGSEPMPPAVPVAGDAVLTTDRTFYVDGEAMAVTVTVDDTAGSDLPDVLTIVTITGANGNEYTARGITNSSGVVTFNIGVGGNFGIGTYTLVPLVHAGDIVTIGASKTVTVDD